VSQLKSWSVMRQVNKRAELAEQQAGIWREAAAALEKLREAQEAAAAHVADTAAACGGQWVDWISARRRLSEAD
jgi:hypothetical protein